MYMSKALYKEIKKRSLANKLLANAPKFDLDKHCFPKQLAFIRDTRQLKTAVCSRRAGKTEACAADLVETCINTPGVNCLYITLTRTSAKRIIWSIIKRVLKDYDVAHKADNTELSIYFDNGSVLYVSGAKDTSEIEKFRGMSLKKVYIDECQSFRSYLKELVDDVIIPALWDTGGSLCLIGTPGPVPAGYFYECVNSNGFANYHWTILDNPWIKIKSGKEPEEILAAERERKGITESDPTYMREALGLWAKDDSSLVFKFNSALNVFHRKPTESMIYIFGVDLGYNDADAIAVLGYNFKDSKVYLVEEKITRKQNITALVDQINVLQAKYNPVKMVMDAGALGKKIQDEIRMRHQIPLEAADKHRKHEFIELLNDDLRTGRFQAFAGSAFEEDCSLVIWDRENPEKPVISDRYHSDITDAVLYAWRECKHYVPKDSYTAPKVGSNAYMDELEAKEAESMRLENAGELEDWGVEGLDDLFRTNSLDSDDF